MNQEVLSDVWHKFPFLETPNILHFIATVTVALTENPTEPENNQPHPWRHLLSGGRTGLRPVCFRPHCHGVATRWFSSPEVGFTFSGFPYLFVWAEPSSGSQYLLKSICSQLWWPLLAKNMKCKVCSASMLASFFLQRKASQLVAAALAKTHKNDQNPGSEGKR